MLRQSQLAGRARLRGLLSDTAAAREAIEHEAHRFANMRGEAPRVIVAAQLFPTPPELADRVIELADIQDGHCVLEPSAGTGNLLTALDKTGTSCSAVAIEINAELCKALYPLGLAHIHCRDFLGCGVELGTFDRIVMNPPFTMRSDVKHIQHARKFLKPGGRLVAICMNGPQRGALRAEAAEWYDLPAGAFRSQGTSVETAIVVFQN